MRLPYKQEPSENSPSGPIALTGPVLLKGLMLGGWFYGIEALVKDNSGNWFSLTG